MGSLLFLIIAILSVVADWMGKRRKAQSQADRSHRSPQPGGSQSSAGMPGKPAKSSWLKAVPFGSTSAGVEEDES
ncbi:MAG: hypothetical protein ACPGL0_02775 [Limisphaerales bacterium]